MGPTPFPSYGQECHHSLNPSSPISRSLHKSVVERIHWEDESRLCASLRTRVPPLANDKPKPPLSPLRRMMPRLVLGSPRCAGG
jgi:hypothetical protein